MLIATGLYTIVLETGYLGKRCKGLIGLFPKPPPQLGHTAFNNVIQSLQKAHSKVQIIASIES